MQLAEVLSLTLGEEAIHKDASLAGTATLPLDVVDLCQTVSLLCFCFHCVFDMGIAGHCMLETKKGDTVGGALRLFFTLCFAFPVTDGWQKPK